MSFNDKRKMRAVERIKARNKINNPTDDTFAIDTDAGDMRIYHHDKTSNEVEGYFDDQEQTEAERVLGSLPDFETHMAKQDTSTGAILGYGSPTYEQRKMRAVERIKARNKINNPTDDTFAIDTDTGDIRIYHHDKTNND